MGGVLRCKWEAYCDINGRSTKALPFPESSVAPKTLQYKLEAHCNTNWRCVLQFRRHENLSEINSPNIIFHFRFRIDINGTYYLSLSCPHRYFTPNFTFALAFTIQKVINSEIILLRFALISVSVRIGPGKPNQRKVSSRIFHRGIPEKKFNVNRACFHKP